MDSEFQNLYFTIHYVIFKIITSDVEIKKNNNKLNGSFDLVLLVNGVHADHSGAIPAYIYK